MLEEVVAKVRAQKARTAGDDGDWHRI